MPLRIPIPNVVVYLVSKTYNPASVAANTTAENATTITVSGVQVGDWVRVTKPTNTAGLFVAGARVSATDTIAVSFGNVTGASIDPPSEDYLIEVIRPDGALLSSLS